MHRTRSNEGGFTLIELLSVIAVIGILAGIQLLAWSEYKENAYTASEESAIHNVKVSLEGGKASYGNDITSGFYWASQNTPGDVQSWDGLDFLPGYKNPSDFYVSVMYNGRCDRGDFGPWCVVSSIWARNCNSDTMTWSMKWADGLELSGEMGGAWGC